MAEEAGGGGPGSVLAAVSAPAWLVADNRIAVQAITPNLTIVLLRKDATLSERATMSE